MKIELRENAIVLIAESDWELKALRRLRTSGVETIRFEDDWDGVGGLILQEPDKEKW